MIAGILGDRAACAIAGARRASPTAVRHRPERTAPASEPTVSVVVPCYNYGHFLTDCVRSILDQRDVDVEVVIVDDASTDGSADVAASLAAGDRRVGLVRHHRNAGHIATYNDGLARVTGDYVVLLSADDRLTPGALARATALMEHHTGVGFVYGGVTTFTGAPPSTIDADARSWVIWRGSEWAMERWRRGGNCVWSPEVVMRTSVWRQVGGYRSDLPHTADLDVWLRAAALSDVGYIAGPAQALYRLHQANMHATDFAGAEAKGVLIDLQQRLATFEASGPWSPASADPALARRGVARAALRMACHPVARGLDAGSVQELMDFAVSLEPAVRSTRQWRSALRRRRRCARATSPHARFLAMSEVPSRALGKLSRWPYVRAGAGNL